MQSDLYDFIRPGFNPLSGTFVQFTWSHRLGESKALSTHIDFPARYSTAAVDASECKHDCHER